MKSLVMLLLSGLSMLSYAADERSSPAPQPVAEQWLQMQREGTQASSNVQSASVVEQEKASERWLKSYDHPIPDQFEVEDD